MGRNVVPARAKVKYRDGTVLYAWRPRPRCKEITSKGPGGEVNLKLFRAHILCSWKEGVEPTKPGEYLATTTQTAPAVITPKGAAPTLRVWIGDPADDDPGEFFDHSEPMSLQNKKAYESGFRNHGAFDLIGDIPMDQVTAKDAIAVRDRVLQCPQCADRAALRSPSKVVPESALRADNPPFDHEICERHYPSRLKQRYSVRTYFAQLKAAFNAAMRAKVVTENPFAYVRYGTWDEPETNAKRLVALTHLQLDAMIQAHPEELKVIPSLSTPGMFRREEMWGVQRSDFPVPPEVPSEDPESLTFQLSRIWHIKQGRFLKKGKTDASLGNSITIGSDDVRVLNNHLRNFMPSSPDCNACAGGERIWRGDRKRNPHVACGFANDAPLIPRTICAPDDYSRKVCPQAQQAAGLGDIGFKITHMVFRTTGAVQYLDAGVPLTTVVKMGRWSNAETPLRHYNRLNQGQFTDAIQLRDRARAAELGYDVSSEAPLLGRIRFKDHKIATLSARCDELEKEKAVLLVQLDERERAPVDVIVPLPGPELRGGKWDRLTDIELRATIESASSQMGILLSLGLSAASKNYVRLRTEAKRLKVELPERWGSLRTEGRLCAGD